MKNMKIAVVANRKIPPGSDRFNDIISQLRPYTNEDDPIQVLAPRIQGQESNEFGYPSYACCPYVDLEKICVDLGILVKNAVSTIRKYHYDSVYLYGAGSHTKILLKKLREIHEIEIVAIVVSRKEQPYEFGLPVFGVGDLEFSKDKRNLVIFSSNCYEEEMYATFRRFHPQVECMALYRVENSFLKDSERSFYFSFYEIDKGKKEEIVASFLNKIRADMVVVFDEERVVVDDLDYHPTILGNVTENRVVFDNQKKLVSNKIKTNDRPKLLFVDQCLRTENGHYFNYAKNVLVPANGKYKTFLVCKQCIEIRTDFADHLLPVLRFDAWGGDIFPHHGESLPACSRDMLKRLLHVFDHLQLKDHDHVFIPNVFDYELEPLIEFVTKIQDQKFQLHLLFRYDIYDDFDRIARMKQIRDLYDHVHFHTDTQELQTSHTASGEIEMNVMAIPVSDYPLSSVTYTPPTAGLRVVSLGIGRAVKGFYHLPNIIEEFFRLSPESDLVFEIQNFTDDADEEAEKTVSLLNEMKNKYGLVLHSGPLTQNDYEAVVDRADVILALYDPDVYRDRSSHVVSEALCYGKSLVITRGCAPANLLDQDCPWIVDDPKDASETLNWMNDNWEDSQKYALRYQQHYSHVFTGQKLIESFDTVTR